MLTEDARKIARAGRPRISRQTRDNRSRRRPAGPRPPPEFESVGPGPRPASALCSVGRLAVAVVCFGLTVTACDDSFLFDPLRIPTEDEVVARLGRDNMVAVDDVALFRGFTSEAAHVRGNGCLAATKDGILFVMWLPKKRVWIPRSKITRADAPGGHLLRVGFVDEGGRADFAVWAVRDPGVGQRISRAVAAADRGQHPETRAGPRSSLDARQGSGS